MTHLPNPLWHVIVPECLSSRRSCTVELKKTHLGPEIEVDAEEDSVYKKIKYSLCSWYHGSVSVFMAGDSYRASLTVTELAIVAEIIHDDSAL